jgi:ArsR family metal-binding transcriptional regulator
MRLLYQSEQMEKKKDDLLKAIGGRVHELKENGDMQILKDRDVSEALSEIGKLNAEIESIRKKASEISRVEE